MDNVKSKRAALVAKLNRLSGDGDMCDAEIDDLIQAAHARGVQAAIYNLTHSLDHQDAGYWLAKKLRG